MNITKLSPVFGAEVEGVDLATISDIDFEEIYRAWVEYGVLRFRNQKLDDAQLEAFSARFGPLEKIPLRLTPEQEKKIASLYVVPLSNIRIDGKPIGGLGNGEANWHSDMTYEETPPPASVLLSVEIPAEGGDTQFCCQHAALLAMPESLRARLAQIRIKHDASHTSIGKLRPGFDDVTDPGEVPGAIHPAIRRHEENGQDALYLGRREFAYIEGMTLEDSEALLDELWRYASLPQNVWTQRWSVGDVIVWDNRRILHRRDAFPNQMRRMMRRCQVLARDTRHLEFSSEYDRRNLRALRGSAEDRAQLFSHWDEVLPQRPLRAAAVPHRFERRLRPLDLEYEFAGDTRTLDDYIQRNDIAGLLVISDGAVVHERYRLGIDSESRFHIWSAAKSFTSTLLGRALHEGVIDSLDHPVDRFVKISGTGYGGASLRHVLMMSSGVNFFHFKGTPDRAEMYRQIWGGDRDLDDFAGELGDRVAPGSDFNYLATDSHILSMVLRAVYHQPFHQIVQEQLWEAIGMAGDAFWSQHAPGDTGHAFGHACLCPRLLEFAHLGQLYINDGVWNGRRLLPEGFVTSSGTPQAPTHEPKDGERGYGYQWWIPWRSDFESMAAGAFGQMIWLDTKRGVSIAQFGAQSGTAAQTPEDTHAAMRAIVNAVTD